MAISVDPDQTSDLGQHCLQSLTVPILGVIMVYQSYLSRLINLFLGAMAIANFYVNDISKFKSNMVVKILRWVSAEFMFLSFL